MTTSPNSQKYDYSAWPTKQAAAAAIGCSTKLVEQLAKDKKLQTARYRRPEGGPAIAVYHPQDVERLRKERNPDAAPFVLPATRRNEVNEVSLVPAIGGKSAEPLNALIALLQGASQNSEKASVRIAERLYLTFPEASAYSGLPQAHLKRLIEAQKLPAQKTGGGWRIRRSDLEKL